MVWRCKSLLLEMASPDAIARLPASGIKDEAEEIWKIYFNEQQHSSLAAFMSHVLQNDNSHLKKRRQEGLLVQVSMMSHHCCIRRNAENTRLSPLLPEYKSSVTPCQRYPCTREIFFGQGGEQEKTSDQSNQQPYFHAMYEIII